MNSHLSFLSFWSINGNLEFEALKEQLDELKRLGLEGVVFHPRNYPNEPRYLGDEYMNVLSRLILYAKSIGMSFWIYDENGWPSGTAGGEVLARHPELICHWVEYAQTGDSFRIDFRSKQGVSSLDPAATAYFIEITHESYRKKLAPEAFDYVTGFFSDEVAFLDGRSVSFERGGIPWSEELPDRYLQRYGEDLLPDLPLLFADGEKGATVKTRYWELATDLLAASFYQPIDEWCRKHGKAFTAHLKAEESPFFQLTYSGSCFRVLRGVSVPAVDALERFAGNHFYPRIAHSIAMQYGSGDPLAEAMGGSGWGTSPEHFENYLLWLAGHGLRQFVIHLNQLHLNTEAIHDWPPSLPCHMTWKEAFPSVLRNIRKRAAELPDLRGEPELLIVAPTRGVMAAFVPSDAMAFNEHDGSRIPDNTVSGRINRQFLELVEACHQAGIHYELTEERAIEEDGVILSGKLRVGERGYGRVLVAEGCVFTDPLLESKLRDSGIVVLSPADWQTAFPYVEVRAGTTRPDTSETVVPEQTSWKVRVPDHNQLFIEFRQAEDGSLTSEWNAEHPERIRGLSIVLHDSVDEVLANGREIPVVREKDLFVALIPDGIVDGLGKLRLEVRPHESGEAVPVAFLRGRFAVVSLSAFTSKDERQLMTKGPFALTPMPVEVPDGRELIASGFPFSGTPIQAAKRIKLGDNSRNGALKLAGIRADTVYVRLGGMELGWCWEPDWILPIPSILEAGSHDLLIDLYPSTFNAFGPHRHIDGDRHLTSPDQYRGVKNFADHPDAPDATLGEQWHFVRWGIEGDVKLISRR